MVTATQPARINVPETDEHIKELLERAATAQSEIDAHAEREQAEIKRIRSETAAAIEPLKAQRDQALAAVYAALLPDWNERSGGKRSFRNAVAGFKLRKRGGVRTRITGRPEEIIPLLTAIPELRDCVIVRQSINRTLLKAHQSAARLIPGIEFLPPTEMFEVEVGETTIKASVSRLRKLLGAQAP